MSLKAQEAYPYTRAEECSWTPEEVARHLTRLLPSGDASQLLGRGWSSGQVVSLRAIYGNNEIKPKDEDESRWARWFCEKLTFSPCIYPIFSAFTSQLKEPLILMLLASAAISLVLGNSADSISIALALGIVSLVAAIQEYRSEAALEKLASLVPHTCNVLREGRVLSNYPAKGLVVGDLVLLATGDRVPADCRLVDVVDLSVDESSLTGENTPAQKTGTSVYPPTAANITSSFNGNVSVAGPPIDQQCNIAFCGTLVVAGRARALVVAVGQRTEFGKVAQELQQMDSRKSPLQVKIDELGQRLAFVSSYAIGVIAVLGWLMGRPFLETLTVAVSLAVAAIPEGLPICVTVTLALGVLRMARRNAIVKRLPVVESLGCATVVASDKTGTLTQNEMTARSIYLPAFSNHVHAHSNELYTFTGVGYCSRKGVLVKDNVKTSSNKEKIAQHSMEFNAVSALFGVACVCNNASIGDGINQSDAMHSGQPTEIALLIGAHKAGVADHRPLYHRLQEVPFSSERKRMEVKARPVGGTHACKAFTLAAQRYPGTRFSNPPKGLSALASAVGSSRQITACDMAPSYDGSLYFVKGMPEAILAECKSLTASDGTAVPLTEQGSAQALTQSRRMATAGLRVLAMAYGPSLDDLIFAGLVGMEDPPREGVPEAVRELQGGGVNVLMVTGDAKETAVAIARKCGILTDNESSELGLALSGEQLDAIGPHAMADSIVGVRVFYRVAPRHKLALVRALQQHDNIVAMTGDGVNDATALKGADIGVAMGRSGTDVAKEAADVVLADDDFATMTHAVAEGKGIFFNIRNFLSFQLSTSFAALTMASVATLFGLPSPLNAMQILWINIIMDGPPAQSLGVEPVDNSILQAKPRKPSDPIVTRALLLRAVTSAALIVFLTLRVFANELLDGQVTRRDTTMTFMTFVNCDLINAYVCRSASRCFYEIDPLSNPTFLWAIGGSIAGQLSVIYFPPLQEVFQTESLSTSDLMYIISLSSTVLMLDTLRKKFFAPWFLDEPGSGGEADDFCVKPHKRRRSLLFTKKDTRLL